MTTSEPTTGEIVRALREDCNLLDDNTDKFAAADRLELLQSETDRQERDIARLTNGFSDAETKKIINRMWDEPAIATVEDCQSAAECIISLTARAEQLEMERDAYMAECDSGRTRGYNEGYSDGYQDGTKGI